MSYFEINYWDDKSQARVGKINTGHGAVNTPTFLPIGTKGAVKTVTPEELKNSGADIVLANTYHLWQRPGDELIAKAGGLHKFMAWDKPIFTDSGGFQVFSLAKIRQVKEEGVIFRFDMDGREEMLSPEKSMQIQMNLGSDIALILDDFPGYPFVYEKSLASIELTCRWAERAIAKHRNLSKQSNKPNPEQKLWGIVQGASFSDLRQRSAKAMANFGFEGFAIGGVAVGEPHNEMMAAVEAAIPFLPEEAPRHLLGVGTPYDIIQAVARGCDTFDCVIPTREARHGKLYVATYDKSQQENGFATIDIRLEKYKEDFSRVDDSCNCYLCKNYTKAYLRHIFAIQEPLAIRLTTLHNLQFYLDFMARIRAAIQQNSFGQMLNSYLDIN